jgi:N-acetylneuraminic acid mutarotase
MKKKGIFSGFAAILALCVCVVVFYGCGGGAQQDDGSQAFDSSVNGFSTGPQTYLAKTPRPAAETRSTKATFAFSCSAEPCSYKCKLDDKKWGNCVSPKSYVNLTGHGHYFQVKATDSAGNVDSTPASYKWYIYYVWRPTATKGAPTARYRAQSVWTGSKMIVWGGEDITPPNDIFRTGGVYDPATNSWTATSTTNAPSGSYVSSSVWAGDTTGVMIVWGGEPRNAPATGGRYNPSTNSWSTVTTTNAVETRSYHSTVWTGSKMIVWGGLGLKSCINSGAAYDPSTDTWAAISSTNAPSKRSDQSAVWTGSYMIVWGGIYSGTYYNNGAKYDPSGDTWTAISTTNAPDARRYHTAVWTGSDMIVWGGYNGAYLATGGKYNLSGDSWTAVSTTNAPSARKYAVAVWTDPAMVVWGGIDATPSMLNTGGKYDPSADTWTATSTINAPSPRAYSAVVWTGNAMIIWGGYSQNGSDLTDYKTGGRYWP